MAALQVLEKPVLLHITMDQKSFEKINLYNWLLTKVVLLECIDNLALILWVFVKVEDELVDLVVKSVEHTMVPSLFLRNSVALHYCVRNFPVLRKDALPVLYGTYRLFVDNSLRSSLTRLDSSEALKLIDDQSLGKVFFHSNPVVLMPQRRHQVNFRLHLQHLNDVILLVYVNCDCKFVHIF